MKKYIVVTGASSGIGAATAKAFARCGENLIVIARRAELLENLKDEIANISPDSDVCINYRHFLRKRYFYDIYNLWSPNWTRNCHHINY